VRHHDFRYWLFHPAVVFVLQGAVWYVIFMLRKRLWMALVAAGLAGLRRGAGHADRPSGPLSADRHPQPVRLMMVPGFVMMRQAQRQTVGGLRRS
jgi:hypothetical protein